MRKTFEMCRRIEQISHEDGDIYIRCAGHVGRQLCYEMHEMGINIRAFLDRDKSLPKEVEGVPVIDPAIVYEKEKGSFLILIAVENDSIYEEICNELVIHGLKKELILWTVHLMLTVECRILWIFVRSLILERSLKP